MSVMRALSHKKSSLDFLISTTILAISTAPYHAMYSMGFRTPKIISATVTCEHSMRYF